MNGLPGAEPFREVSPRNTGLGDVEDGVEERPVVELYGSASSPRLGRQQRFQPVPLLVAQFVTMHQEGRSSSKNRVKSDL